MHFAQLPYLYMLALFFTPNDRSRLQHCPKALTYESSLGSSLRSQAEGSGGKGTEQGPKPLGECLSWVVICLPCLRCLPHRVLAAGLSGYILCAGTVTPRLWLRNRDQWKSHSVGLLRIPGSRLGKKKSCPNLWCLHRLKKRNNKKKNI